MRSAFLFLMLGTALLASAQTPSDITSEPHHELLLQNDQVRVFAVTLRPTEQAFVQHDHNFLMVTLQTCEVVMWPEGASAVQNFRFDQGDVRFFFGGHARGLRNDRTETYRAVIIEFFDDNVTTFGYQRDTGHWEYGSSVLRPPVDPHAKFANAVDLGAATATDIQLLPGDELPPPEKPSAELIIPVTDIDLKAGENDRIRKSSGEAVWIPAGRKVKYISADNGPTRFVVVESKVPGAK